MNEPACKPRREPALSRDRLQVGELLALKWQDMDLVAGHLIVRRTLWRDQEGPPKGGRNRKVPLSEEALLTLKAHRHLKGPYAFCDAAGIRLTHSMVKEVVPSSCRRAGLGKRVTTHGLRHSFASHLVMRGASLKAGQDLLGHESIEMTLRYSHLTPDVKREAVRLLDRPEVGRHWTAINSLFDPFFPKGLQWYWKGDFVKTLSDEAIDAHIAQARDAPTPFCLMAPLPDRRGGAAGRKDATPWGARDASWSMVIAGISPDPKDAEALKRWGRAYWKALHRFNMEGGYVNFMDADEADNRVELSYGDNYRRLAKIKAKYDPDNLFHVNQNIKPKA